LYTEENWFEKHTKILFCELFPFHPLNLKIALLLNEERARFADDLLSYYNFCCGFLKKTNSPPPKKTFSNKIFPLFLKKKKVQNKKKKEKRDRQVACLRFKRNHIKNLVTSI